MAKAWTKEQNEAHAALVEGKFSLGRDYIYTRVMDKVIVIRAKKIHGLAYDERDYRTADEHAFCRRAREILNKRDAQLSRRKAAALAIVEAAPGYDGAPC